MGELRNDGKNIHFLGRVPQRYEKGMHLRAPKAYINDMIGTLGMQTRKHVGTTGSSTPTRKKAGSPHLDAQTHRVYRRAVGILLWLVPIRPGPSYISKELSRALQSPPWATTRSCTMPIAVPKAPGTRSSRSAARPRFRRKQLSMLSPTPTPIGQDAQRQDAR